MVHTAQHIPGIENSDRRAVCWQTLFWHREPSKSPRSSVSLRPSCCPFCSLLTMFYPLGIVVGILSFVVQTSADGFHVGHRAVCTKKKLCNGNLMCAYVCERGSVQVDQWAVDAISYQRTLQYEDKLVYYEMPSTHNSAITEADGFGIEKYFISALYNGKNEDAGDDVGEGVCQYLSLTDQLRMGARHVEIDLWWGPINKEVEVCHSPIPLIPFNNITRAAEDAGLNLEWDWKNMSCIGTKRRFTDVMTEIKDFLVLPGNENEIMVLYLDTKFQLQPDQVTAANQAIVEVFGSMLWKYTDGNPLQHTVKELVTTGKRVIFENQKDCWMKPSEGEPLVFTPALWTHQFGADAFVEFPSCIVEGDSAWYGKQQVRSLDGSFIEAATKCGVQVVSGDYTNPDEMKFYVWSWDAAEPSTSTGCVAMTPSGRWATLDCATPLPYACQTSVEGGMDAGTAWSIDLTRVGSWSESACPAGSVFSAPHNGYANSVLLLKNYGQTMWLNAPNPLNKGK